jgi:hypothetical protein
MAVEKYTTIRRSSGDPGRVHTQRTSAAKNRAPSVRCQPARLIQYPPPTNSTSEVNGYRSSWKLFNAPRPCRPVPRAPYSPRAM